MLCPICKKPVTGRDDPVHPNAFYPFCSDRCQLIDLGRWLDGKYQIPARPDDKEERADEGKFGDGKKER